ncbi:MAG TPA: hypothetical protein VNL17_00040 [Verrucomicrobiae bacterium]|nr:hypothetical protein [Verrucomicrobiae bacterium]
MKTTALILLVSLALVGYATADNLVDPKLAQKAEVILRVKLLAQGEADKYAWYEVEILKVLKNESGETFDKRLKVAAYSWRPGVTEGESTVYLERYSTTDKGLWKLIGGEADTGVSTHPVEAHSGTDLAASMTDKQILRAIGYDPDTLTSSRNDGKDGYSMVYSNETTLVFVTRSVVSGVIVLRMRPEEQKQEWLLGKP